MSESGKFDFREIRKHAQELGIHIIRIKNEEFTDMKEVLTKIDAFLNQIPR